MLTNHSGYRVDRPNVVLMRGVSLDANQKIIDLGQQLCCPNFNIWTVTFDDESRRLAEAKRFDDLNERSAVMIANELHQRGIHAIYLAAHSAGAGVAQRLTKKIHVHYLFLSAPFLTSEPIINIPVVVMSQISDPRFNMSEQFNVICRACSNLRSITILPGDQHEWIIAQLHVWLNGIISQPR